MARGGRPRPKFTARPPTRTRRKPKTQASPIQKPKILPPKPKAKPKIQFSTRPPTRKFSPISLTRFSKVVTGARGRKKIKEVSIRPHRPPLRPRAKSSQAVRLRKIIAKERKSKQSSKIKARPTRVAVLTKKGRTITVSSRSRLARPKQIGSDFNVLNVNFGERSNKGFEGFGAGDRFTQRTRKGGVQQIRLTSKDGTRSRQFNIPADRFDRSAKDPRAVPLKVSTTRKPKSVLGRTKKTKRFGRPKQPRRDREFGSDFDIFKVGFEDPPQEEGEGGRRRNGNGSAFDVLNFFG